MRTRARDRFLGHEIPKTQALETLGDQSTWDSDAVRLAEQQAEPYSAGRSVAVQPEPTASKQATARPRSNRLRGEESPAQVAALAVAFVGADRTSSSLGSRRTASTSSEKTIRDVEVPVANAIARRK